MKGARPRNESWAELQIRLAQERGDFEDLPGKGKPLQSLDEPDDELWWLKAKLREEGFSDLPPSLKIIKDRDITVERALAVATDDEARALLEALNVRIRFVNRNHVEGPPTTLMPLDVDAVVARRTPG